MSEIHYDYEIVAGISVARPDEQQVVIVGIRPPLHGFALEDASNLEDAADVFRQPESTEIMFAAAKPSRIHSRRVVERYLKSQGFAVGIVKAIVEIDIDNGDSVFMQMVSNEARK